MKVSAIIVNYRCAEDTLAAVTSLRGQMPSSDVIVVDNSADASEARRLRASLPAETKLLVAPSNLGFAAACNWAFRETTSELVLLLNPDARLFPGALARLVDTLAEDEKLAAITPQIWWDEERQWLLPTLLPETPWQWCLSAAALRWPTSIGLRAARRWLAQQWHLHRARTPQPLDFVSGAVLLLRRHCAVAAGGLFDERFFLYYEDADLSRRLRRAGFRLALEPRAEAWHQWRNTASKSEFMMTSARRYGEKYHPYIARWLASRSPLRDADDTAQPIVIASYAAWRTQLADCRIFAISPSRQGFPAIFRPPGSPPLEASRTLWQRLDPAVYRLLVESSGRRRWLSLIKTKS